MAGISSSIASGQLTTAAIGFAGPVGIVVLPVMWGFSWCCQDLATSVEMTKAGREYAQTLIKNMQIDKMKKREEIEVLAKFVAKSNPIKEVGFFSSRFDKNAYVALGSKISEVHLSLESDQDLFLKTALIEATGSDPKKFKRLIKAISPFITGNKALFINTSLDAIWLRQSKRNREQVNSYLGRNNYEESSYIPTHEPFDMREY